jgi:2-polyprenyl-6-methoxyphenol hydroxylase-like FAD-dependent oxidoreductase
MYPVGSNGAAQAIVDARVLAAELARPGGTPEQALAAYEDARRGPANAIVLASRDMPADRILHEVGRRAPEGFDQIEDVLSPGELQTISDAYRATAFPDVVELNTRRPYL